MELNRALRSGTLNRLGTSDPVAILYLQAPGMDTDNTDGLSCAGWYVHGVILQHSSRIGLGHLLAMSLGCGSCLGKHAFFLAAAIIFVIRTPSRALLMSCGLLFSLHNSQVHIFYTSDDT